MSAKPGADPFFPELLEPRRRIDPALWGVIITAYVTGTSTRKVDDLVKARVEHQVVSRAVVIAIGVSAEGGREVLDVDVGDSEDEAFWTAFLTRHRPRAERGGPRSQHPVPRPARAGRDGRCIRPHDLCPTRC